MPAFLNKHDETIASSVVAQTRRQVGMTPSPSCASSFEQRARLIAGSCSSRSTHFERLGSTVGAKVDGMAVGILEGVEDMREPVRATRQMSSARSNTLFDRAAYPERTWIGGSTLGPSSTCFCASLPIKTSCTRMSALAMLDSANSAFARFVGTPSVNTSISFVRDRKAHV